MTKCFVIGPIGEVGSTIRSDADDFMNYIVAPVVTSEEFDYGKPIRADSLNEPGRITSQIVTLLMEAELVIADLTTNNANVFYELSLRHAIGKPVIHMAAQDTPLSFDVRDNRTIFYTMHSRVAEAARDELAKQIRHVRKPDYKAMNPILETLGILNLERSNIPEKAAIGQLMSMVERLSYNVMDIQQQVRLDAIRRPLGYVGVNTVGLSSGVGRVIGVAGGGNAGALGGVAGGGVAGVGGLGILNNPSPDPISVTDDTTGVTAPSDTPKKRK
jgi:hypothetical protein